MARPSDYTPELALAICQRLVEGESLRAICREEGMPDRGTVFRWTEQHAEFRGQYARAREAQAETFADELNEIADDGSNDWMERLNDEGEKTGWQVNGEHIQRSRLRIDTRKWIASKLLPKKYGDKIETTLQGPNGGPLEVTWLGS
jgi:transposase-like protein